MADIKTRDVTRGTIKTLNRAASSMHHLKEETIRSKAADISSRSDNESANAYAPDAVEQYAGSSAAFASRAGIELMLRSRENVGYGSEVLTHTGTIPSTDSLKPPKTAGLPVNSEERIQQAFREQGIKTIRDRQSRKKMADAEVLRNAEEDRLTERIRGYQGSRKKKLPGYSTGRIAAKRQKPPRNMDLIQLSRRNYAIKRMIERRAHGEFISRFAGIRGVTTGRIAGRSGRALKDITQSTKALYGTLTAGGAVALLIIVVMIICGAAFTMVGDKNGDNFAYDFYEIGPGDTAIVKVAEAQLGNVGGDKFWKWYGFSSHVHWCACFVSWCGDQCGYIKAGIIPKFAVVGNGASWFKERHRWASAGYSPKPGDIIFFDWERDGVMDHVGIVESCDGKTVTTIEGNSGNVCRRQSYRRGAACIVGFGIPGYVTNTADKSKDKGGNTKESQ